MTGREAAGSEHPHPFVFNRLATIVKTKGGVKT